MRAQNEELWVYTSVYKEFASQLKKGFEAKYPGIEVQVFQAGSEKIQAKVETELLAKRPQADIILTSDPFWSMQLERRGLAFTRPGGKPWDFNYFSLMVLVAHKSFPMNKRPKSFKDISLQSFKGLICSGSPLESGTTFTTVAYLSDKYGWEYFKALRANDLVASGGNSSVIQRVESGEKKIGVVLLENALAAIKRGSPLEIIYPTDGAISIPSAQFILKEAKNKEAAAKFADFVLSPEGQRILVEGFMYSVRKDVGGPEGAKSLAEVTQMSTPWTAQRLEKFGNIADEIKRKFSQIVLE